MSMKIQLSKKSADKVWGKNALISFADGVGKIHFGEEKTVLKSSKRHANCADRGLTTLSWTENIGS